MRPVLDLPAGSGSRSAASASATAAGSAASAADAPAAAIPEQGEPNSAGEPNTEGVPDEAGQPNPAAERTKASESDSAEPEPAEQHGRHRPRETFDTQARNWWAVTKITFKICMRYRITGLAAEAAFFALLSLPPLVIGLAGTLGYLNGWIGTARINEIKHHIDGAAGTMLSGPGVQKLDGLLTSLLTNGHPELISIGFLLALWAGSRAMNVYVDTITIAYGLSGRRGIVRTRLLAFGMYLLGLVLGSVALPLLVIGPDLLVSAFPPITDLIHAVYWPLMLLVLAAFLNTLYHLAVPVRTPWSQDLPGTILALLLWLGGSALLRDYVSNTFSDTDPTNSLYGGLAAAVAILVWLYVTALAVLLGAALNAAVEQVWPSRRLWLARLALRQRVAAQRDADTPVPEGFVTED